MKYILKTEVNENGNLVFSKKRSGKDYIYLAKDENGNVGQVLKSWIIQNQEEIENVRVSGDSIYAVDKKKKIEDFGEKIGGARKDLAGKRAISMDDLKGMSVQEKEKYLKKDKIWPKIDVDEMVSQGYDKVLIAYMDGLRGLLPAKPKYVSNDAKQAEESQMAYELLIATMRNICLQYKSYNDLSKMEEHLWKSFFNMGFLEKKDGANYYTQYGDMYLNKKIIRYLSMSEYDAIEQAAEKPNYMTMEEKIIARIYPIKLSGYRLASVNNDGRIGFQKAFRNGYVTTYSNMYSKMVLANALCTAHSLPSGADSIRKLLEQDTLWGLVYLPMGKNEIQLFGLSKDEVVDWAVNHLDIFFRFEEGVEQVYQKREDIKAEKKEEANRKKRLTASNLEAVERTGPTARNKNIEGQDFIDTFGIRGGEFGNWVSETERQLNMNMCFESFKDLASVLGISDEAVGLNHKLNIAFGARGNGNAVAHYEPGCEVINLTRMKGAGSLAHEYFHAIDDIYGKSMGYRGAATESPEDIPAVQNLIDVMTKRKATEADKKRLADRNLQNRINKFTRSLSSMFDTKDDKEGAKRMIEKYIGLAKEYGDVKGEVFLKYIYVGRKTKEEISPLMDEMIDFYSKNCSLYKMSDQNKKYLASQTEQLRVAFYNYKDDLVRDRMIFTQFKENADELNDTYSRVGHGYWNSNKEMAARAFACYVKDKLAAQGYKNDYLCGHAEDAGSNGILTYPVGQERQAINQAFDALFAELRVNFFEGR